MAVQDFESFFRTTYPRLVRLGTFRSGRPDVAAELAQETLIRAHDHWDDVGAYDAPVAWCRRVMVRLLIDHHRSTEAERRAVERLTRRRTSAPTTPALTEWNGLLDRLTERQRTVVALFYADDLSVDDIAATIDASAGSVKAALFKARQALRPHLVVQADRDDADLRGDLDV